MMRLSIRGANEELLVVNRRMLGGLVCTWPAISRREIIAGGKAALAMLAALVPLVASQTDNKQRQASDGSLLTQDLPGMAGKEISIFTIDMSPGQAFRKHKHPGATLFAYVLEGTVETQMDENPPVTYNKGQLWTEMPGQLHTSSKNLGTSPAKFLVFFIHNKGEQMTVPMQ